MNECLFPIFLENLGDLCFYHSITPINIGFHKANIIKMIGGSMESDAMAFLVYIRYGNTINIGEEYSEVVIR